MTPLSLGLLAFVFSRILQAPLVVEATQRELDANKEAEAKPWVPPLNSRRQTGSPEELDEARALGNIATRIG